MRLPTPNGPPVQPVFTSHTCGLVLDDLLLQQFGVSVGMMHHERPAEAGAEGDLRFDAQADFRPRDLAGIAGDEVVDGLVGSQARDGRHHAGGVAGEENDVLRMARALFGQMIVNVFERISGARVLRDLVVVQIDVARDGIERHVFQDGAEAAGDGVDLRLGFLRKPNDLGVAAVLEIENAVVAPAVLVVANQVALGVGGKRGLAGAGKAEEDGHVAVRCRRWPSSAWTARLPAAAGS